MFEKRIKTFFNSVKICDEMPELHVKLDRRIVAIAQITAGVVCATVGGLLVMWFVERFGKELPESC